MKRHLLKSIFLLLPYSLFSQEGTFCKPDDLKCEYLINPLGVDVDNPRLMWKINDLRQGAKQTAYQLFVGTDSLDVLNGKGNIQTSEKIKSNKTLINYSGEDLQAFTRYYWSVKIWDKDDSPSRSAVASFETGMRGIHNWRGAWVGDKHNKDYKPAPYFRKVFETNKKIKSARVYITAAGLYELYINGDKVGNERLEPVYTKFDRRNMYLVKDVTSQLENGQNVIGVLLGNGWYNHQSLGVWNFDKASWRNRPAFCFDLRITYTDGSIETISSDTSWKTSDSPLQFNSIYTGEHYDARLDSKDWLNASFEDSKWERAIFRSAPSSNIVSQQMIPIRNTQVIIPQSVKKINDSCYVFDLGRNIAGVTQLKISGEAGTVLTLKHGERIYRDGRVDISNLDVYYRPIDDSDPFQTDIVTLSGGNDEFMPKFNYKGFRYIEVNSSRPIVMDKHNITAYFMHSDVLSNGEIEASDSLINKLWQATNNSYLSNLMGYPTDCPQREKNGWTADAHLAIETALYNYDAITIYEKWLADHRDEQQPNGVLPDIIPTGGWGYGTKNGLDWTSSIAIIPWQVYMFYGDSKLLADCYDNIKRYVDYVDYISPEGLTSWGRGDWVPVKSRSNMELTSSIYFFVDATILADAAKLFGKQRDYEYYQALAEKIKKAINDKYLNHQTGIYANGTQTELSMPLYWKLVPKGMINKVAQNLAKKVEAANYHLDVGILGAKTILNALNDNGYSDIAYKLAVQDTYPSWGWWIVNGATTLLENWDLDAKKDISDNHMMFGEIGGWFYKGLGGIYNDPDNPGFKHIILRPNFVKDLNYFKSNHHSPHGLIVSNWEWSKNKKEIIYSVRVPANTTATLYLPEIIKGERIMELESGEYIFKLKL